MDPDAAEGVLETGIVSQAERWPSFCFTSGSGCTVICMVETLLLQVRT